MNREIFDEIVSTYLDKFKLDIKVEYNMPNGYENAFGTFDIEKNTLYLNAEKLKDAPLYKVLFFFFHELHHACEYKYGNSKYLNYVVLYDGTCFKLKNRKWVSGKLDLKGVDFLEVYKSFPYEIEANKFAFNETKLFLNSTSDKEELEKLFKKMLPNDKLSLGKIDEILDKIDEILG